jgi:histidyl-tRNA synthetase
MRDFMPDVKAKRERVLGTIREVYRSFGYQEIETPPLEDLSRLTSGQGGENEKMLFQVLKRGLQADIPVLPSEAADLGLRFDLTLPLARFYATNHAALPPVFRAVQIGSVWRAERPQKGRFRQFTQCDIDVLGEGGVLAEVELIVATLEALRRLAIDDCALRLNDRKVLLAILDHCGFEAAQHSDALITVDKLDKIGVSGVRDELVARNLGSAGAVELLMSLLGRFQELGPAPDFEQVAALLPAGIEQEISALREIKESVAAALPAVQCVFDISLVRGMGYYTGPIFELVHPSSTSSIAGGGRYDGMVGRFLNKDVPACGFSIGFERIVDLVPDSPSDGTRRRALIYSPDVPVQQLVTLQAGLVAKGLQIRLVQRAKRLGSKLAQLEAEGFTEWQELTMQTGGMHVGDVKSLSGGQPSEG